jgi:hypothetical protein
VLRSKLSENQVSFVALSHEDETFLSNFGKRKKVSIFAEKLLQRKK